MSMNLKKLDDITMGHGGIYKAIDEYRELLGYVIAKFPEIKESVLRDDWIIRIMRDQDRLLHQIASLQPEQTRIDQSCTGIIRSFPFDEGAEPVYVRNYHLGSRGISE